MSKKSQSKKEKSASSKLRREDKRLLLIPLTALVVQIFIALRIQGFDWYGASDGDLVKGLGLILDNNYAPPNAWLGADGENYLRGLWGLAQDGFYSTQDKLSYWPAGYPLLLWPILNLFGGYFFLAVSILQSLLYAGACAFFVFELKRTRLDKFARSIALILAFNPTLALNTIAIGYELPVASLTLLSIACMLRALRNSSRGLVSWESGLSAISLMLATFMQPRLILFAFLISGIWGLNKFKLQKASLMTIATLAIVAIGPSMLIQRNVEANGFSAISTNLGTTMGIGSGPGASGGYRSDYEPIPCPASESASNPAKADNARVRCVIVWYLENPVESSKQLWNKARFFWSPWFGPEANGTMARNPWRENHPFNSLLETEGGFNFVVGPVGKLVSWFWMLAGIVLLARGTLFLWRMGGVERTFGLLATLIISVNMLTSMFTIGDHRFRIPTMGLSLVLQAIGLLQGFGRGRITRLPMVSRK